MAPTDPVIVAIVELDTATVLTVNVPVVLPAATVADAETVAFVELLESFTTTPPVGAGPDNVAVPFEELPPASTAGESAIDASVGGVTVRTALNDADEYVAPIVAVSCFAVGEVPMLNVALA